MLRAKRPNRVVAMLSAAAVAGLGIHSSVLGNTELDVNNGATDLTSPASYSQDTTPNSSSDVTFDSGITYAPTAFTINSSLNIGTLDDLDGTQSLSISNTGTAADILTLSGGTNSVSPGGANDLLYVASGGTLTITGGSGATALGLSLAATGNLDIAGTATISSIISGSSGLTKTGSGTLILSAANSFTGTVTIVGGTLKLGIGGTSGSTSLGAVSNNIVVDSGATLDLNGNEISNYTGTITISGTGVNNNGAITNSSGTNVNNNGVGNIVLGGNASIGGNSGRFDITGSITGNGYTLTKIGTSYMADRSTTSTLTSLVVAGGSWEVSTAVGMGVNAATTTDTVQTGAYLTFYNAPTTTTYLPTVDLNGGGLSTGSGSANLNDSIVVSGNGILSGNFNFAATSTITGTGNLTVSTAYNNAAVINYAGSVNNNGNVIVSGNELVLSGTNGYSGSVSVTGGILDFLTTASMSGYPNPQSAHPVTVSSGATVALGVGGTSGFTATDIANVLNGSFGITFASSGSYLGLDTTNAGGLFTYSNVLSNGQVTSLGYAKFGTGVLALTGSNTYSGPTIVYGGVLRANDGVGLPSNSLLNLDGGVFETGVNFARTGGTAAGDVEITGGTSGFSANGGNITVAFGSAANPTALTWGTAPFNPATFDLNETSANGTLNFLDSINLGTSARTIQVNATAAATAATLSGLISSGSGGGITKVGAGTLILTNTSNSYSGPTTISGGTLEFVGPTTFGSSNALNLAGGTFQLLTDTTAPTTTINFTASGATSGINVGPLSTGSGLAITLGALNNGVGANSNTIDFTASGGYTLAFPSLALPNGTGNTTVLVPTSTSVTITGNVTDGVTSTGTHYDTLVLDGTSSGNAINGAITDSSIYVGPTSGATILTKQNTSTWTLAGASTYRGATNITGGTLRLTGSLGDTIITVSGTGTTFAALPGTGSNSAGINNSSASTYSATGGATLTLGSGTVFTMVDGGIGTFNLQQGASFGSTTTALSITSSTLDFEIGNNATDLLSVGVGKAAVSGTNIINLVPLGGSLTPGATYPLITANQGLTGTFQFAGGATTETINVGGTNYVVSLQNSSNQEAVSVSSILALTWTGQNNGNGASNSSWDTTTASTNWATGSTPVSYTDGSPVVFQDQNPVTGSNVTNSTVTIQSAGVFPASVTFNNSAVTYTLNDASGSSAGISGSASVTKSGSGTVILAGTNTYTGGTALNGGILQVAAAETAGTSGPLGASGTISFAGGTLQYSAADTYDYSSRFSTAASQAIIVDTNGQNVTWATALTSSGGSLTKNGAGTLTLTTGNNISNYTGATVINGGILALTGSGGQQGVLAGTPTITINPGAELLLNGTSNDTLGYTAGRGAVTINDGSLINNGNGIRVTFENNLTMIGGTLGGSSKGDNSGLNGAYSFNGVTLIATSDASGNPATVSAPIGAQQTIPFNVARGTSSSLTTASPDLLVSSNIVDYGSNTTNGITKTGSGIMVLAGPANNYTGATTVSAGTLRVNGNVTGNTVSSVLYAGTFTVASGATLGGSGTIVNPVTVNGTITAGPDALTSGLFTTGAQTWNGAGNDLFKLASSPSGSYAGNPTAGGTSTTWDELNFTTLTLDATASSPFTLTLDYTGPAFNSTGFTIPIAYSTTSSAINGGTPFTPSAFVLAATGNTLPPGTSASNYSIVENPNDMEIDLVYTPAPEPGGLCLLTLGAGALLARRRRRI